MKFLYETLVTSVTINASCIGLFSISSKQSFALFYQLRMKIGTVEFRLPSEFTPKFNTHDLIGVKHVLKPRYANSITSIDDTDH